MTGYPVFLNGRTTQNKPSWKLIKGRYGKPVLTPIWGADVTESRCIDVVKPSMMTTAEGQTPRSETILKTSWPNEMDNNRFKQSVQPPVREASMPLSDHVSVEERREKSAAECPMPPNGVTIDRSWHKVMNSNRNEKPIRTRALRTVVRESDCVEIKRGLQTVEADRCVDRDDEVRPGSGQAAALTTGGIGTVATNNRGGHCTDCNKKTTTSGTVRTNSGDVRKPLSGLLPLVVNKLTPTDGTGAMHYQWIVRESIKTTEMKMPRNYLEIPELKIPKLFLHLAEEARNSELVDDQSTDTKDVQPQRTGQTRPVLITEIMTSTPVLGSRASRVTNTSTEMIPDINRDKPVNRSGPVGQLSDTEQPIMLGVMTDKGANGPNGPVGHDVMLAGRMEMVNRPDPVGPYSGTEQSVFLRLDADQGEHIPTNRVHPGVKMFRTQPVADGPAGTDEMYAVHDEDRPTAGGPVGRFPDPGPLYYSKMSSPDDSYQPLVTGPSGTNGMNAINNPGRPTAGGPLGRPFKLDPMGPRAMLSLGDGNQPTSVGPVGRPWTPEQPGDKVTKPDYKRTTQTRSESESDTRAPDSVIQTESEVHRGRVNISKANGPTDSSVVPPSSGSVVHSLGKRTTQTKSESDSVAGIPDPVIRTGSEVQTDRVNISMANGPTDSTVTPPSSDSGVHSLGEQWENMSTNSTNTGSIQTVKTFYGGDTSQVDR